MLLFFLFFLLVLLALVVTELDSESKRQLGKLLHVIKVDVGDIITRGVDVRTDIREITLRRNGRTVTGLGPGSVIRA